MAKSLSLILDEITITQKLFSFHLFFKSQLYRDNGAVQISISSQACVQLWKWSFGNTPDCLKPQEYIRHVSWVGRSLPGLAMPLYYVQPVGAIFLSLSLLYTSTWDRLKMTVRGCYSSASAFLKVLLQRPPHPTCEPPNVCDQAFWHLALHCLPWSPHCSHRGPLFAFWTHHSTSLFPNVYLANSHSSFGRSLNILSSEKIFLTDLQMESRTSSQYDSLSYITSLTICGNRSVFVFCRL